VSDIPNKNIINGVLICSLMTSLINFIIEFFIFVSLGGTNFIEFNVYNFAKCRRHLGESQRTA